MPTYEVVSPDGTKYRVNAPEGASQDDAIAYVQKSFVEATKGYKAAEQPKPYGVHPSVASAMNIGNAVTLGFGDEIAGFFGADKGRYRETIDQFREQYPWSAGIGSASGSMLLPFGAAKLAAKAPMAAAATVGAVTGGLQGAGDAENMGQIPGRAASGAIFGTGGGVAGNAAANAGAAVAGAVRSKIPALADDWANTVARSRIGQAFERDQITPMAAFQQGGLLGPEARFADSAGESTRGLLDLTANLPGKTATELESTIRGRIASRPERMDSLGRLVSANPAVRAGGYTAELEASKRAAAAPLYDQLRAVEIAPTDSLRSVLDRADKLGALAFGRRIATAEGHKFSITRNADSPQTIETGRNSMTNAPIMQTVGSDAPYSMRDLDYAKRGIDTLIERETDPVSGKVSSLGRSYLSLKNELVDELDRMTTDPQTGASLYKAARDAFAGPAALQTAVRKGRAFWNDDAEKLSATLSGLSASEREAFSIGAAEQLRKMAGEPSGQNRLLDIWKNRNTREKLRELLGDDAKYSDAVKMLENEQILKRMEGLGPSRNSRTFSREAAAEDTSFGTMNDMASIGANVKGGNIMGLLGSVKNFTNRLSTPEPVRDAIGNILLRQPSQGEAAAIAAAREQMLRAARERAVSAGLFSGVIGGGLY